MRGSIRHKSMAIRVDMDCSGVQKSTGFLAEHGAAEDEVGLWTKQLLIRSRLCDSWLFEGDGRGHLASTKPPGDFQQCFR